MASRALTARSTSLGHGSGETVEMISRIRPINASAQALARMNQTAVAVFIHWQHHRCPSWGASVAKRQLPSLLL
jgi:hypothetical protein